MRQPNEAPSATEDPKIALIALSAIEYENHLNIEWRDGYQLREEREFINGQEVFRGQAPMPIDDPLQNGPQNNGAQDNSLTNSPKRKGPRRGLEGYINDLTTFEINIMFILVLIFLTWLFWDAIL